jgi:hypothetical protein
MLPNQQLNDKQNFFCRATNQQRIISGAVFLGIAATFGLSALAGHYKIDMGRWLWPCGFKQKFGLPCPTCGMTTSLLAYSQGKILKAFYIQPAGALLCSITAVAAFLALFTALFGVYFEFIKRFFAKVKIRYIIAALLVIVAAGWAVTLARALTARGQ